MVGWMGRCGVVLVVASGCVKEDPDGGASAETSTSVGTASTSTEGGTSGTGVGTTAMTSSETSGGTIGGSSDQTTAAPDDTNEGDEAEESSGGLHTCPGTGYCVEGYDPNVSIHGNHGEPHAIVILREHVLACEERDYDIQGEANHSHIVTLLPGHFGEIDVGGQILVTSSETNRHTHDVWSDCE